MPKISHCHQRHSRQFHIPHLFLFYFFHFSPGGLLGITFKNRFLTNILKLRHENWEREKKRKEKKRKEKKRKEKKRKEKKRKEKKRKEKKRKEKKRKEKKRKEKKRKEKKRKEKKRKEKEKKQVPFNNRTHRTFLLIACVEPLSLSDCLKGACTRSPCEYWHPPECQFYKKETGCKAREKCLFPMNNQTQAKERLLFSPKRRESDDKTAVAIVKTVPQLGCVSQDSDALVS